MLSIVWPFGRIYFYRAFKFWRMCYTNFYKFLLKYIFCQCFCCWSCCCCWFFLLLLLNDLKKVVVHKTHTIQCDYNFCFSRWMVFCFIIQANLQHSKANNCCCCHRFFFAAIDATSDLFHCAWIIVMIFIYIFCKLVLSLFRNYIE